jgi:hypothetical protein
MRIWFSSELSGYHMNGYWVPYLYFGQIADKVGTRMYPRQVVDVHDVGALSVYSRQAVKAAPRCILSLYSKYLGEKSCSTTESTFWESTLSLDTVPNS